MTFTIRDMSERDVPELDALLRAAYGIPRSYEPRLRAAFHSGAARTFVADDAAGPAGMATLHDYGASGYVSLVGVLPERQGRGIARRLMEALVADSDARGHRGLALEASAAGRHLYDTMGFAALASTITVEGPRRANDPSWPAAVRRATVADCDAVCAYDRAAFGADRGATIVPWFARADCPIFVAPRTGGIDGYAVVREGRVSPWLAQTPALAAALFAAAQSTLDAGTVRVSLPEDNAGAVALAAHYNWSELQRHAYMVRGTPPRFPRTAIYSLISLGEG
jgi:GNAT superfamily N-acetyltransferase